MASLLEFLKSWGPALLCASSIFSLSHQSSPPGEHLAPDFVGHLGVYFALGASLVWGASQRLRHPVSWRLTGLLWSAATVYGAFDEIHQIFVPDRHASLGDLLFDAIGAMFGVLITRSLSRGKRASG